MNKDFQLPQLNSKGSPKITNKIKSKNNSSQRGMKNCVSQQMPKYLINKFSLQFQRQRKKTNQSGLKKSQNYYITSNFQNSQDFPTYFLSDSEGPKPLQPSKTSQNSYRGSLANINQILQPSSRHQSFKILPQTLQKFKKTHQSTDMLVGGGKKILLFPKNPLDTFTLGQKPDPVTQPTPKKHQLSSRVLNSFNDYNVTQFSSPELSSFQKIQKSPVKVYNCLVDQQETIKPEREIIEPQSKYMKMQENSLSLFTMYISYKRISKKSHQPFTRKKGQLQQFWEKTVVQDYLFKLERQKQGLSRYKYDQQANLIDSKQNSQVPTQSLKKNDSKTLRSQTKKQTKSCQNLQRYHLPKFISSKRSLKNSKSPSPLIIEYVDGKQNQNQIIGTERSQEILQEKNVKDSLDQGCQTYYSRDRARIEEIQKMKSRRSFFTQKEKSSIKQLKKIKKKSEMVLINKFLGKHIDSINTQDNIIEQQLKSLVLYIYPRVQLRMNKSYKRDQRESFKVRQKYNEYNEDINWARRSQTKFEISHLGGHKTKSKDKQDNIKQISRIARKFQVDRILYSQQQYSKGDSTPSRSPQQTNLLAPSF